MAKKSITLYVQLWDEINDKLIPCVIHYLKVLGNQTAHYRVPVDMFKYHSNIEQIMNTYQYGEVSLNIHDDGSVSLGSYTQAYRNMPLFDNYTQLKSMGIDNIYISHMSEWLMKSIEHLKKECEMIMSALSEIKKMDEIPLTRIIILEKTK